MQREFGLFRVAEGQYHAVVIDESDTLNRIAFDWVTPFQKSNEDVRKRTIMTMDRYPKEHPQWTIQ